MKSFLDFIQSSLFYLDPKVQRDERVRAPANTSGTREPIRERVTLDLSLFPESPDMILFPIIYSLYIQPQNLQQRIFTTWSEVNKKLT